MQEVFEKIIEKLEEECFLTTNDDGETNELSIKVVDLNDAIEIVKQTAAEYDNGWIPVDEELPDHHIDVEVTLASGVREIGWYSGEREEWIDTLNIHEDPLNVIAWKEPSEPYRPNGE